MHRFLAVLVVLLALAGTTQAQTTDAPMDPTTDPTTQDPAAGDGMNDPDTFGDPADDGPTAGDVPGDKQGVNDPDTFGDPQDNGIMGFSAGTILIALLVLAAIVGLAWYAMSRRDVDRTVSRRRV